MFDRLIVNEPLFDCRGDTIATRGTVLSAEAIAEAARRASSSPGRALEETPLAADADAPLEDTTYRHLFAGAAAGIVRRAIMDVRLPEVLFEELLAMRRHCRTVYAHALATAAVTVRMLLCAASGARSLSELAAAALLHDIGMRHLPNGILRQRERLGRDDAARVAAHPLVGAYHLASVLGAHPAVAAAQCHHWRCGQGYPALARAPSRATEVVSVASAFTALTQPRPFREEPYDSRGASDVLAAEAKTGHADANTVKLLVHALRGGRGDPRSVRFGRERAGHGPEANRYVHVPSPARSPV